MRKFYSILLALSILATINAQTKLTSPNLIGSTTNWGNNNTVDLNVVFDGDFNTFMDVNSNWGFIGYDFGTAGATVASFKYAPRNEAQWTGRLVGAVLRGSNSSNFLNEFDELYTIPVAPPLAELTEAAVFATKPYRYIYLFMGGGTYSNISEFELYDAGSSKLTGTLIGQEKGSSWCETCTPAMGVDGNFDTYVEGPTTISFVGYDFGEGNETVVTSWKYAPRSGFAGRVNGSELRGSNSPDYLTTYTVLSTVTTEPSEGVLTEATVADANPYRYIYWSGKVDSYANISELELYFQTEPVLSISKSAIVLDGNYPVETFLVSSSNLSDDITITTPEGIVVEPAVVSKNKEVEVYAFWDGTAPVEGDIVLSSGSAQTSLRVKTVDDSQCYVPYSTTDMNYVLDPGLNSLSNFAGWGRKAVRNLLNDPSNVYCGASSISIGDSLNTCAGSLDVNLTGAFEPNTTYIVRAMLKTMGGSFQLGVWGWTEGQGDLNNVYDTQGEWQQVEFTFTTGETIPSSSGTFINNCSGCTGVKAYADNWEIYNYSQPVLSASIKSLVFDPEYAMSTFSVQANNLTEEVSIVAPEGIITSPASVAIDANGKVLSDTVTVLWDGTTAVNDSIELKASGVSYKIAVVTTSNSNTNCFIPLYDDKTNIITDPYLNDLSNFGGWGNRKMITIADQADSVYCGSHSIKIENSGSLDWVLTGKLKANTSYIVRAMVRTFGGEFQMGSWGAISNIDSIGDIFLGFTDKQVVFDTYGEWAPVTMQFETKDSVDANSIGIYINNYFMSGRNCFVDNWEMYEMSPTALNQLVAQKAKVYLQNGKIAVEFNTNDASSAEISVYTLSGALLSREMLESHSGKNSHTIHKEIQAGVYLVKLKVNSETIIAKIVK